MLWSDILERVRSLAAKQTADTKAVNQRVDGVEAQIEEFRKQLIDIQSSVDQFIAAFEHKLAELAKRGAAAKKQAGNEPSNLQLLHGQCNLTKGKKCEEDDLIRYLQGRVLNL